MGNVLDAIPDVVYIVLGAALCSFLAAGAVLLVVGTLMKNRFGINFRRVKCPQCGEPAPAVRMPKNLNQTLFGGCTCPECDCEYDKWGRPVES
jgi:hypothetical protein